MTVNVQWISKVLPFFQPDGAGKVVPIARIQAIDGSRPQSELAALHSSGKR